MLRCVHVFYVCKERESSLADYHRIIRYHDGMDKMAKLATRRTMFTLIYLLPNTLYGVIINYHT
jgi:hypothetical protein